jgi:hypothetical protein
LRSQHNITRFYSQQHAHLALYLHPQGTGRERYVFFSFPHIGIDEGGEVGAISRPGRAKKSCACGALAKCLNEIKADGLGRNFAIPGGW